MGLSIGLHQPARAIALVYDIDGEDRGSVALLDADGQRVTIYTTPRIANAIAEAFKAAKAEDEAEADRAWESANDPEAIAARQHAHDDALRDAGRGHLVRG